MTFEQAHHTTSQTILLAPLGLSNKKFSSQNLNGSINTVAAYIQKNFSELDVDGDGRIGRADVLRTVTRPEAKRDETLVSAFIYYYRGNLATKEFALNRIDLVRLNDPKFKDKAQRTLDQVVRRADTKAEIFPKHRIDPTLILQGAITESRFTAVLVALAATPAGDRKIRQMIDLAVDGTYIVTFPGDVNHPIYIKEISLRERMVGSSYSDGSQFVSILERAYSLHRQIMTITKERWGIVRDAFELLTGKAPLRIVPERKNSVSTSGIDMRNRQIILQSLKKYKAITLHVDGTELAETSGYISRRRIPERQARGFQLQGSQSYALIDYNEHSRMVTICDASKSAVRDQAGRVQGEINVPLSELERCFSEITIEA